jgi:uncharacterized membrane protein YidH (DUF202 family)
MAKKKSSEFHSVIDSATNMVNIVLLVVGLVITPIGIYYTIQTTYDYLVNMGIFIIIGGVIIICIGAWGFFTHGKIVRRMKKQAKENLNY